MFDYDYQEEEYSMMNKMMEDHYLILDQANDFANAGIDMIDKILDDSNDEEVIEISKDNLLKLYSMFEEIKHYTKQ
jgi:alpha-tubulin suppressor-like RCC1 family protein